MTINNSKNPFLHHDYNRLFEELFESLCQYSYKITKDITSSEDIVQERFIYLWNHWDRLSNHENLSAYLHLSVKNRSINYVKKQFKNLNNTLDGLENKLTNNELPSPLELLELNDLENILVNALNALPEKCRIIFSLKRDAELSNKEIAEQLNISIKTVESQTTIALKRIKTHIAKHWHIAICIIFPFY